MKNVMYLLLFSVLIVACSKTDNPVVLAPVANFSFSGDNNFAPDKVVFLNSSDNAAISLWDFGDGTTSPEANPTHVYSKGGIYNVTLSIANQNIDKSIINKTVTIKNAPTKLKINSILLTNVPFINPTTGASWDSGNGPDVFFTMLDAATIKTVYFTTTRFDNIVASNLPLTFSTGFPVTINSLDFQFNIYLVDYNSVTPSVSMGGYTFNFKDIIPIDGNAYPTELRFESTASELKFKMNIEWVQ